MGALFFIVLFVGIIVYFVVQDRNRRDTYDPSYLKDLYNGTLNDSGHYHHHYRSHSTRNSGYSSRSHRSSFGSRSSRSSYSSRGRGGGGRGSGGGAGRR